MFGWPKVLIAIFISYLIGGIISLFLLIVGKKTLNSKVPLGPFLAIGSLLTLHFF
jgi:prepilin signal peptidase PulO-like enzyme (type II secretory pathway)